MSLLTLTTALLLQTGPLPAADDWLIHARPDPARVIASADGRELTLENGLVRRIFRLEPTVACYALDNLATGASLLRAVRPEARVVLDGVEHAIGGLTGQPDHAFLLPEWLDAMQQSDPRIRFIGYQEDRTQERFPWKRTRHHAKDASWPPPGVHLRFEFGLEETAIRLFVHYELYDGLPVFSKWLELQNGSGRTVELDRFCAETLAVVEEHNWVEQRAGVAHPRPQSLHVETDYAFGGFQPENALRQSVHWRADPDFHTQVNYQKETPCLLVVEPERGPDQLIPAGASFESFRVFELVHDSTDRERRGLALKRMYRAIAPWVTENPLILHVVSTDPEVVKNAIDQAAECGFEMVSLSFGSGLDMEDESDANLAKFREFAEYAGERGIHLGGYSLLASRRIQPDSDNCINAETGEPGGQTFGYCPALASHFGQEYFRKLRRFFEETGFLQFTHDGSYPGDFDACARPPLQRGLDDSQWVQWKIITDFYHWLRARGAYLRVPDYYYLSGANECGMGYREVNWSLPRALQVIHTRQNIYDGTWRKTPSMGWMFVPLTQYHGGGATATIEPLSEHLDHYERMLASNLGMGVQAVYRGMRLYDTAEVRDRVKAWVDWYKEHREILESDMIHGRRADGRDLDWMLHVDPRGAERGMLVVYNPLADARTTTIRLPLYYTGLTRGVRVSSASGAIGELPIARDSCIDLEVTVPSGGMSWYLLEAP
ncbi:MAG: alpha-galactosidase [Planctomycetota bacterium]